MAVTIEVCIDSLESAKAALKGGANRLEICGNLGIGGGTTPSYGLVQSVKTYVKETYPDVELVTMIRPRTGDFCYSDDELSIMLLDIQNFATVGVTGVVFGCLSPEGDIDIERTLLLVDRAKSLQLQVCFHRAFDMAKDQIEALHTISRPPLSYISRILTSGGGPTALASIDSLTQLFSALKTINLRRNLETPPFRPLSIMPGSGVNLNTIENVLSGLLPYGLTDIHLSGGGWFESRMQYRKSDMGMGVANREWGVWMTDEGVIQEIRQKVDNIVTAGSWHSREIVQ